MSAAALYKAFLFEASSVQQHRQYTYTYLYVESPCFTEDKHDSSLEPQVEDQVEPNSERDDITLTRQDLPVPSSPSSSKRTAYWL
ncbi:hypothetical protein P3T76_012588 [Phytophthora citrophthora]|uniref:Uncharacterized protein n=1 Tax=Phytophthora citrophthora TaxID=4793 RepID=A0AAD9G554_9STRA|nr:hypothetical protein P3T76_012588 [Phytophthora citrophthora]